MNNSTYIFGRFGRGYTQYPLDSNSDIFEKCVKISNDKEQLIVVRQDSLMFYTFVRFLNDKHTEYIGLSLSLSSMMISDIYSLFSIFEDGLKRLAIEGEILNFKGEEIICGVANLSSMSAEVRCLDSYLSAKLVYLSNSMVKLPPKNYDINSSIVKKCKLSDDSALLFQHTQNYGYVVISMDANFEEEETELQKLIGKCNNRNMNNNIFSKIKNIFR